MNGKDVFYFSHDSNARNDERILMLRAEHGWAGYGLFWALIEMMFESRETCLYHSKIKGIAVSYNIDITLLQGVIDTALSEGLFTSDNDKFWSESLRTRKNAFQELREKRSEAGKKGMEHRWNNRTMTASDNGVITKNNKGKERKGKKIHKEEVFELPDFINSSLWKGYLEMRSKIKKPMTDYAQKLAIGKLERFKQSGENPNAILEQSIIHSWQGLFSVNRNSTEPKKESNIA
jgi:hypothetical protein